MRILSLSANNISEISRAAFYGLAHLEHLDLSYNSIEEFNQLVFEIFSISSFDPKLELLSLNVSSNRLDSLDEASVMWLKDTAAVTDLSENPWKCECSALGEAWWELRHKLTLNCASPEDRRGRTWDLIEEDLCPHIISSVEISSIDKLNISSDATLIVTKDTYSALEMLIIVVIFVGVVCFVVIPRAYYMQQRKKLRRRSEVP